MTTTRDAQLSALLDGALSSSEERALREEIARDPALAARLDELARVDAALRAIPARPVPADLRARLQAKLDAAASARPQLSAIRGGAPRRPRVSLRAWGAGFAAAAAAALAVVIGLPDASRGPRRDAPQLADATPPRDAETSAPVEDTAAPPQLAMEATPRAAQDERASAPTEPESAVPTQRIASAPAPSAPEPMATDFLAEQSDPSEIDLEAEFAETELAAEPVEEIEIEGGPLTLLIEMNEDEHAALASLALEDAGVVGVLDVLDALDALEAEAS